MRKLMLVLFALVISLVGYGQSVDECVGNAIHHGEWRELRCLYQLEGNKLQTSLLHPLSKFFINNFYNQPDSALHYGAILLNEHQAELGGSVGSVIYLMADNFARIGDFENASNILHQFNEALEKAGLKPYPNYISYENQYRIIADCGGFKVVKPNHDVKIPIRYHSNNRKNPVMIFVQAELNGKVYDVTYDTGAGVNGISQEFANKIGAHIFDIQGIDVTGVKSKTTKFAVVDSIKLGDIIYRNVPFQIIDFTTGHHEAEAQVKKLNLHCILGNQTMFPLEELQFDFANSNLIIPAVQSTKPDFAPNLYRSGGNQLILSIFDTKSKKIIEGNLDTGHDVSMLTSKYYNQNKSLFTGIVPNDSVRIAGVGGVKTSKTFSIKWEYEIGKTKASLDSIRVSTDTAEQYDCLFGLSSLIQHDLVIINFKDMWTKLSPIHKGAE